MRPRWILAVDLVDLAVGRGEALGLVGRHRDVADRDGHAAAGRELEADALDAVDEMRGLLGPEEPVALVHELLERGALHDVVVEAQLRRQDLVEDDPADRGLAAASRRVARAPASQVRTSAQTGSWSVIVRSW